MHDLTKQRELACPCQAAQAEASQCRCEPSQKNKLGLLDEDHDLGDRAAQSTRIRYSHLHLRHFLARADQHNCVQAEL